MFGDLSGFLPAFVDIPIWDQYVALLEHALDFLARNLKSAGLAVIVFTICIKTLLLPLTVQSIRSSKAMQELQPKVKELQKKYGKDRQKISQETMKMYSEHRVNPMAGCFPMLIQIPIFFGLYRAIANLSAGNGPDDASDYWALPFLWLDNLATPDPYHILPVLAGIFQFIQTKMMRPANQGKITDPQQAMMNTMMNFMPLMVVVFGWNFDSGPVIYWVTQSVYSVVQQWFITGWGSLKDWMPMLWDLPEHRRLGYRPPRDLDDVVVVSGEGGVVAKTGFMGWVQKRMDEAQAQQAARLEERSGGSSDTSSSGTAVKAASSSPSASSSSTGNTPKAPRPVKKSSPAGKAQKEQSTNSKAESVNEEAITATSIGTPSTNGAKPRVVPKKSRPSRPTTEDS